MSAPGAHDRLARPMLDLAARAAARAAGLVEPNPLVGAVVVGGASGPAPGRVIGVGHHRIYGGPHAEVEALADCRRRGHDPRGGTMYVTLEPCAHWGKQPPCVDAVLAAGVARVVAAREDPNPLAAGGAAALRAAGVAVEFTHVSRAATRLCDAFVKRVTTGLPHVIAKWAQTIDGKVATRDGESKWISSARSRLRVHRLRARVDAILTGAGTVRADDPTLTARGVPLRRTARRVVIDPRLTLDPASKVFCGLDAAPTTLVTAEGHATEGVLQHLRERGVQVWAMPAPDGEIDVRVVLRRLLQEYDASNVLVEAGPRLLGRLFREDLIDECQVYLGPLLLGDHLAADPAEAGPAPALAAARRFELLDLRRIGDDARLVYRRRLA